jgi:uncharacterized membrane protein (DUF2068 family)
MTEASSHTLSKPHRNRWLVLIASYKVGQALLFAAVAVGAMRLVGKDVGDQLQKLVDYLQLSSGSRIVTFLLEKSSLVNDTLLRRVGTGGVIYAGLSLIEGVGLLLEQTWAEYLTAAITGSFLPWELFEVLRRATLLRVSLLVVNALVFFYLLKLVMVRGKERQCVMQE